MPLGTVEGLGGAVKLVNSAHPIGVTGRIFLQVTHYWVSCMHDTRFHGRASRNRRNPFRKAFAALRAWLRTLQ